MAYATPRYATLRHAIASATGNQFLMVSRLIPCTLFIFYPATVIDLSRFSVYMA
jgi:hypothetical protein